MILLWTRFTNGLYRCAPIAAVPWLHPAVGTWVLLPLLLQTQGRRPDHVLTQRDCDCALDPNLAHCYQVQCRRTHVRSDAVMLLLLNLNPTAYRILLDAVGTVTIRTEIVSCLCYSQNIYEEKRNFGVTRNTWDGLWNKIGCFSFNPFYEFKSCWQVDRSVFLAKNISFSLKFWHFIELLLKLFNVFRVEICCGLLRNLGFKTNDNPMYVKLIYRMLFR